MEDPSGGARATGSVSRTDSHRRTYLRTIQVLRPASAQGPPLRRRVCESDPGCQRIGRVLDSGEDREGFRDLRAEIRRGRGGRRRSRLRGDGGDVRHHECIQPGAPGHLQGPANSCPGWRMAGEFLGQAQRFLTKELAMNEFSRRTFFHLAGTIGAVASEGFRLSAQQQYPAAVPLAPIFPYASRSPVSLVKGDVRRKNVLDALLGVDREIRPAMARKKYVLIKINNVSVTNQLAATHVDAIRGILDYVAPRFKGPVVIAEASARDTLEGFPNYKYAQVIPEFKAQKIKLVDLNREKKYEVFAIVDRNIRPTPVRLAAQLMDPDAFVISSAMLKT